MKCKSKPRVPSRAHKTKEAKEQATGFRAALDQLEAGQHVSRGHAKLLRDLKKSPDGAVFVEAMRRVLQRQKPHRTTLPTEMLPPLP